MAEHAIATGQVKKGRTLNLKNRDAVPALQVRLAKRKGAELLRTVVMSKALLVARKIAAGAGRAIAEDELIAVIVPRKRCAGKP